MKLKFGAPLKRTANNGGKQKQKSKLNVPTLKEGEAYKNEKEKLYVHTHTLQTMLIMPQYVSGEVGKL